jgi:hypothetical protein
MSNIGTVIYTILKNNSAVNSIVGTGDNCRVYPLIDNQSYTIPFITFMNVGTNPNPTKSGVSTYDERLYQLNIVANTPEQAKTLSDAVRAALDYATGTYSGVVLQICMFEDEKDLWSETVTNDGGCMVMQDYKLSIVR